MTTLTLTPAGPFSLDSSIRFLGGFTPASYGPAADQVLRLAFPADDSVSVIGCALRQEEEETADGKPGTVSAEITVRTDDGRKPPDALGQISRILSLDIDGTGFPALADNDPIVAGLQADYPGLRPVCFPSPYEAAAWTIIGNRIRTSQAATVKARLAQQHGHALDVAGRRLNAFPAPAVLRSLDHIPGLTGIKIQRLHAIAEAALDGYLDADELRAQPAEHALAALRELPGIGPFSAELILIRGAGHPDVFPTAEPRVHRAMADAYQLDTAIADNPRRLARIADAWRPYRSWIALLLRARAQDQPPAAR
ncbi:DNA-3-methyladenine glycosylase family protein [Streptomyces sp. NPDC012623]|uniref:DNA-3-methyladenine glycosylase family protein n=1 Tax=unclassified Streptomyces TaxID=2593676 RepID=UPI00368F28BC